MRYTDKPDIKTPSKPPYKIGYYCSNSDYIINGQNINEKGYWTKSMQNINLIYAIDENCRNMQYLCIFLIPIIISLLSIFKYFLPKKIFYVIFLELVIYKKLCNNSN